MSIGNLCSTGKKENSSGSGLYINIVNIPNQSVPTSLPTRIIFLSNIEIKNYSDLIRVLELYGDDYDQPVILVGGEYVNGSDRYAVNDMYNFQRQTLYLTYRTSSTRVATVQLATTQNPPNDWTYANIPL